MSASGPSYVGTWLWDGKEWTRTGWNPPAMLSATNPNDTQIAMTTVKGVPMLLGDGPVEQQPGGASWQTWKWSYETWAPNASAPIPVRSGFATAQWNGGVVVFGGLSEDGGQTNDYLSDLWTFDGTTWRQQPASGPPSRANAMMSALGNTLVLFGGSTSSDGDASMGASGNLLSDTWTWDGSAWTQRASSGPSARAEAVVAPLHGQLILFGGETADGNVSSETWSWNGSTWSALDVVGPSARRAAVMTPVGGKLLLFGGLDASGTALADAWTFDGSNWTPSAGGPPPLVSAAMAGF